MILLNPKDVVGVWKVYDIKNIPRQFLDIEPKRFKNEHMLITELFDYDSYNVYLFFKNCPTVLSGINKVLVKIRYPFDIFGRPNDEALYDAHRYFLFMFLVSLRNRGDFWKKASEVVRDRYGDCEDTSTLMHSFFLMKNIDSFWVLGRVYYNGELLGGHAWVIAKLEDNYRLVETTLEEPVESIEYFPTVDITKNIFKINKLTYEAILMIHNKDELWIVKNIDDFGLLANYCNIAEFAEKYIYMKRRIKKKHLNIIKKEFFR